MIKIESAKLHIGNFEYPVLITDFQTDSDKIGKDNMDNFFVQKADDVKSNSITSLGSTKLTDTSSWTFTIPWSGVWFPQYDFSKKKNAYVPKEIHVNEKLKIVVVKWEDGTESKVTCDNDDVFNVESGFAHALTHKIFGGKKEYKTKWWKIISRRIHNH